MPKANFSAVLCLLTAGFLCNTKPAPVVIPQAAPPATSVKVDYGVPNTDATRGTMPAEKKIDEGAIGDVKYSILPPTQFTKVNGNGWVLMGGQPLIDLNSDTTIMQVKETLIFDGKFRLPDARGVFIRGMQERRDDGKGNPDGPVPMGKWYQDLTVKHSHELSSEAHANFMINESNHGNNVSGGGTVAYGWTDIKVKDYGEGNKETRPRNISLYIYVKVRKAY